MANRVRIIRHAAFRRIPFTLVMLLGIGTVGLLTGTNQGELAPNLLQRWGFAECIPLLH